MEPSEIVPRNERKAQRVLAALSLGAVGLSVGGFAFDLYVLGTHHLSVVHAVSNALALIPLVLGARFGISYFRDARARLTAGHTRAVTTTSDPRR